jgi:hypothetical protein
MKIYFHPEFPKDIRKFEGEYARISPGLAERFRREIDEALNAITSSPGSAGHFLHSRSSIAVELRRKNLRSFPFFVLYGMVGDQLILGSVIPSRSDPLTWLVRFS